MKNLLLSVMFAATLVSPTEAQQSSDPRVADLVRAGKIRVGVHSIMYTTDSRTGQLTPASTGIILSTSPGYLARGSALRSRLSDIRLFPRC